MNTISYSLRNATINFTVEAPTADKLRAMSDELLIALASAGIDNVAYRAAAKDDNDGKSFSLEDIAKLAVGTTRKGEPSKADVKSWEERRKALWAKCEGTITERTAALRDKVKRLLDKVEEKYGDSGINRDDDVEQIGPQMERFVRLSEEAAERRRKAANIALLMEDS